MPVDLNAALDTGFKILEIVCLIGGAGAILYRVGRVVSKFEAIGERQSVEIGELKTAVKEVSQIVTSVAVQTQRLDNLAARMTASDVRIDELRKEMWYRLAAEPKPANEF